MPMISLLGFSTRKIPIINHIHNTPPWLKRPCLKSMAYGISCTRYNWIFTVSSSILHEYIFGKYIATKSTMIGNPFHAQMVREKSKLSGLKIPSDIVFLTHFQTKKPIFIYRNHKRFNPLPSRYTSDYGRGWRAVRPNRNLYL